MTLTQDISKYFVTGMGPKIKTKLVTDTIDPNSQAIASNANSKKGNKHYSETNMAMPLLMQSSDPCFYLSSP